MWSQFVGTLSPYDVIAASPKNDRNQNKETETKEET